MRYLLILMAFCVALSAMGQKVDEQDIPEAVIRNLEKEFPDSKIKGWEKAGENYQARTKIEGSNAFLLFSPEGDYLYTSFPVDERELPSTLLQYVDEHFPPEVVFHLSDLVESATGEEYYFVELRKEGLAQGTLSELRFDPMGELLGRKDFQSLDKPQQEVAARPARTPREKKEKDVQDIPEPKARSLDESEVPEAVRTSFLRRYRFAEDLVWDTMGGNYLASFFKDDLHNEMHYAKNGEWVMSKEEMAPERLYAPISRFLTLEYPGYRLEYAEKVSKPDRYISYYVEVSEKVRGVSEPLITRMYFDKTGKIEKVEEPDIPDEDYAEDDGEDPWFDEMLDEDIKELGQDHAQDAVIKESELPSGIPLYIYEKYADIKIRDAIVEPDPEHGTVYRVAVSKEGLLQESYDVLFDRTGNLLEDRIPADVFRPKEKKTQAQGQEPEDVYYEDRTAVSSSAVPSEVTTYFSRRFPRAEEVEWSEEENGYYTSRFYYRELLHHTTFNPKGELLRTKTEMPMDRIYRPILMYVEESYPKYKIEYAEKIIRTDRVNYYYVELYTKKRDLPEKQYLFFDKMGKPIDEEPAL